MKRMIILPIAIVVSIGAVWGLAPRGISGARKIDLVNGSHDSKAIPDRIAYSLMFRLISGGRTKLRSAISSPTLVKWGLRTKRI